MIKQRHYIFGEGFELEGIRRDDFAKKLSEFEAYGDLAVMALPSREGYSFDDDLMLYLQPGICTKIKVLGATETTFVQVCGEESMFTEGVSLLERVLGTQLKEVNPFNEREVVLR